MCGHVGLLMICVVAQTWSKAESFLLALGAAAFNIF
jgi:hypothetical protein